MEHNDVLCPYCGKKMRPSMLCSVGYEHAWHQYKCEWCRATSPAEDTKEEAYKAAHRRFESAQPKWISVEERLPEEDETVIVCADDGCVYAAQYWGHGKWRRELIGCIRSDTDVTPTHWMPLPEPPKEDNDANA